MTTNIFLNNLKHRWLIVASFCLLVLIADMVLTLIQPWQYQSTVQVLILQKINQDIDAYSAIKSAEQIAKNLQRILVSSSFRERVLETQYGVEDNFGASEKERRNKWEAMINSEIFAETSVLKITVYNQDPKQAESIALGIAEVLETQGAVYHGGPESVEIKTIDNALTSKYPVKPNLILNLASGLILSLALGLVYIYLTAQPRKSKTEVQALVNDQQDLSTLTPSASFSVDKQSLTNSQMTGMKIQEMDEQIIKSTNLESAITDEQSFTLPWEETEGEERRVASPLPKEQTQGRTVEQIKRTRKVESFYCLLDHIKNLGDLSGKFYYQGKVITKSV